jgi:hypothetical protein
VSANPYIALAAVAQILAALSGPSEDEPSTSSLTSLRVSSTKGDRSDVLAAANLCLSRNRTLTDLDICFPPECARDHVEALDTLKKALLQNALDSAVA